MRQTCDVRRDMRRCRKQLIRTDTVLVPKSHGASIAGRCTLDPHKISTDRTANCWFPALQADKLLVNSLKSTAARRRSLAWEAHGKPRPSRQVAGKRLRDARTRSNDSPAPQPWPPMRCRGRRPCYGQLGARLTSGHAKAAEGLYGRVEERTSQQETRNSPACSREARRNARFGKLVDRLGAPFGNEGGGGRK
jgi:hypothetical protein